MVNDIIEVDQIYSVHTIQTYKNYVSYLVAGNRSELNHTTSSGAYFCSTIYSNIHINYGKGPYYNRCAMVAKQSEIEILYKELAEISIFLYKHKLKMSGSLKRR